MFHRMGEIRLLGVVATAIVAVLALVMSSLPAYGVETPSPDVTTSAAVPTDTPSNKITQSPNTSTPSPDTSVSSASAVPTTPATESSLPVPSPSVSGLTAPAPPMIVTAVPGNAQAAVSWEAPVTGTVLSYTVTSSPDSQTCSPILAVQKKCVVRGLTNGTAYTFTVVASGTGGKSDPSQPSAPVTPSGTITPSTGVTAVPGNAKANVTWTAPSDTGGSPIAGYQVTTSTGEQGCGVTGTATTCEVTGLNNGTPVSFTVTAHNGLGQTSVSTPSAAVTPIAIPDPPTNVVATASSGSASINWTAPIDSGAGPVSSYTATSASAGNAKAATCTSTTTTCTVSGLTNNTSYTFTVVATTSAGSSPPSPPSEPVTPGGSVPSAPTNVVAQVSNSGVTVSWGKSGGGATKILSYTATAQPNASTGAVAGATNTCTSKAGWVTAPDTKCTITGLGSGTYTIAVVATNASGASSAGVDPAPVVVTGAPGAPTNVVAQASNASATVSWTAPTDGGSPITKYNVYSKPGSAQCIPSGTATTCSATGLTNGTSYTFVVEAVNATGTGAESVPSNAVVPTGVPGVPTGVSATAQDGQATVSWKAPKDTGGLELGAYTVTTNPGVGSIGGIPPVAFTNSVATSLIVTGLTDGQGYNFTVTARNAIGESAPSSPSNTVTPAGSAPSAPTNVVALAGSGSAAVSWDEPGTSGATSITAYTVVPVGGPGLPCSTHGTFVTAPARKCSVTGLTNGTSYTFRVVATNKKGDSPPGTSNAVTPAGKPAAPSQIVATPGDGSLKIAWTAPSDGGSPITGYTATAKPGFLSTTLTCSADGSTTNCEVSGATNGKPYAITVVATNSAGSSAEGSGGSATPFTTPDAPQNVTGDTASTQVTLKWKAPKTDGGSAVTGYTATGKTSAGDTAPGCAVSGGTSCVITGLTNKIEYVFTVVATNTAGNGPGANSPALEPGQNVSDPPTDVSAVAGNTEAKVSWQAPADHGSYPILSYKVTANPGGATCSGTTALARSCTVKSLTNATAYTFTATAYSFAGTSEPSSASAPVTPAGSPGPATGVTGDPSSGQIAVSWTAPESDGGAPITGYTATATPTTGKAPKTLPSCSGSATNCTITGLTNGTGYSIVVTTTNQAGQTSKTSSTPAIIPVGAPEPPQKLKTTSESGQVELSWKAPVSDGGAAISQYLVTAQPGGSTCQTDGVDLGCTVPGLTNKTEYTFTATATNSEGTSGNSNSATATPGKYAPETPINVTAVAGEGSAKVTWTDQSTLLLDSTVTANPGDKTCTALGSLQSCTVSGLTNGQGYTFTVVSRSALGTSTPSVPSSPAVTPQGKPTAPVDVTAAVVSGAGSGTGSGSGIAVTWEVGALGSSLVTSYTATATTAGYPKQSFTCTSPSDVTSCTIDNPTGGRTYAVEVVAVNAVGTSKPTKASGDVTPESPPSPPLDPSAVAGPADAVVSWTKSANNGGKDINGYTVTSTSGGQTCTTKTLSLTPYRCKVTGLTAGDPVQFSVTATTSVGTSVPSALTEPVTPGSSVPGAPTGVTASVPFSSLLGQASISWSPPASQGASRIEGYVATSSPAGATCESSILMPHSCHMSGLTAGTSYTFTAVAHNTKGDGPASEPSAPFIPLGKPTAPQNVTGSPGTDSITANWIAPASDGGSPITGYTAKAKLVSYVDVRTCTAAPGATSCVISGLTNHLPYELSVVATNAEGTSPAGDDPNRITPLGPPSKPLEAQAFIVLGEVHVAWLHPLNFLGAKITGYTVTAVGGSQTCTAKPDTLGGTCVVKGLPSNVPVTFTVVANSASGDSPPSAPTNSVTPGGNAKPGAPTGVTVTGGTGTAAVAWSAPADQGGGPITSYTATAKPGGVAITSPNCTVAAPAVSCTIPGLADGKTYAVTVTAKNMHGASSPSSPPVSISPTGPPSAPQSPGGFYGNQSLSAYWVAPVNTGGAPITSYTATAIPSGQQCSVYPQVKAIPLTFCTIAGLSDGASYQISVVATNAFGTSPAGVSGASITPAGPPTAPQNLKAVGLSPTSAKLSWSPPASSGGTPIASYIAVASDSKTVCEPVAPTTSCVMSGLTGKAISFTVRAKNKAGLGPVAPLAGPFALPASPIVPDNSKQLTPAQNAAAKKKAQKAKIAALKAKRKKAKLARQRAALQRQIKAAIKQLKAQFKGKL